MENTEKEIAIIKEQQKTMSEKIDDLTVLVKEEFGELKKDLKENYVLKVEFVNVKTVVYGLVSLILLSAGGALISLIIE